MVRVLLDNKYLIRELVARDIHSRYIGSVIGLFWSILNPVIQLALYTTIFSGVLKQRFEETGTTGRFALYLFCALLPWMAVQEAVTRSARVFIENSNLIRRIQFPLEVLPFSLVASAFIHQCLGSLILLIVLVVEQSFRYQMWGFVFLLFALQLVMMYGLALTVACLNVFFRDIAQILGVVFMLFFWITPIVYPKSQAPGAFGWVLALNPLTHMVQAYRHIFLGSPRPPTVGLMYWLAFCFAACWLGLFVLKRTRRQLVDLI
ncbi:MAG: ABC transporter permease [Acidobacteriota bacterium]